jgi:hypothetical protein
MYQGGSGKFEYSQPKFWRGESCHDQQECKRRGKYRIRLCRHDGQQLIGSKNLEVSGIRWANGRQVRRFKVDQNADFFTAYQQAQSQN